MAYVPMNHMRNGELFEDIHVNQLIDNVRFNHDELSNKQNIVTDLEGIRAGAQRGFTSVQPDDLASCIQQGSNNMSKALKLYGKDGTSYMEVNNNHADLKGVALHVSGYDFDRGIDYSFTPDKILFRSNNVDASGEITETYTSYLQNISNIELGAQKVIIRPTSSFQIIGDDGISSISVKNAWLSLDGSTAHKNAETLNADYGVAYSFVPEKIVFKHLQYGTNDEGSTTTSTNTYYTQSSTSIELGAQKVVLKPTSSFAVNSLMIMSTADSKVKFDVNNFEARVQNRFVVTDVGGSKLLDINPTGQTKLNTRLDVTEPERQNVLSLRKDAFEVDIKDSAGGVNWLKIAAGGNPLSIGRLNTDNISKTFQEIHSNGDLFVYGIGGYVGNNSDESRSLQTVVSDLEQRVTEEFDYYEQVVHGTAYAQGLVHKSGKVCTIYVYVAHAEQDWQELWYRLPYPPESDLDFYIQKPNKYEGAEFDVTIDPSEMCMILAKTDGTHWTGEEGVSFKLEYIIGDES